MSALFARVASSAHAGEDNDCAVKALALIARASYANAHRALAAVGREPGEPCFPAHIRAALEAWGFTVVEWDAARLRLEVEGPLTVAAAHDRPDDWAALGDGLLFLPGHVAAYVGGTVEDWSAYAEERVWMAWRVLAPGQRDGEPPPVIYL